MASLLISASPWENTAPLNSSKKKATMKKLVYGNKTNIITRPPPPPEPQEENEEIDADMELELKPRFSSDMDKNMERQNVVHAHIKDMAGSTPGPVNAGDFLASFKPLSQRNPLLPNLPNPVQQVPTSFKENFQQNNPAPTVSGDKYSNYSNAYHPQQSAPYYTRMGLGGSSESGAHFNNDKLMEKINYLIHLLEEQQSEKTNYVTEEFLLYGFLGIFMIFIVDSFSRAGKYVR